MNCETYNKIDKTWSGVARESIFNTNVSVGYLILNEFKKTPERVTQVSADTGVEVTCYEMRQRSIKVAKHLQSLGLAQGDVVGIMATDSEYLAPIIFACFTLGLPISTIVPFRTEKEVIHMYSKTKPKIIFCDANIIQTIQNASNAIYVTKPLIYTLVEKIEGYKFLEEVLAKENSEIDDFVFPELVDVSNSTAVILCTSATTGPAKGICKSHSQLIQQHRPIWDNETGMQEVYFIFSSVGLVTGFYFLMISSLYGGLRVITKENFDPQLMVDICDRYQVTTILTAPAAISKIVQTKPMKSIRTVLTGGATLFESLWKRFERFVPNARIMSVYASTEGDVIASNFKQQRYGSCGFPAPNVQMKIVDDEGNHLGPNRIGEICYKTRVLFSGYFNDPEKTAETLVNGWVVSGDMGYFDEDGFLFIIDRKKDVMKYNDIQIFPSQLEKIIDEMNGVQKSCVVGVTRESEKNHLIFAFVTKEPTAIDLSEVEIENFVNGKVADEKKLRGGVHTVDHIPVSPIGKLIRRDLRDMAHGIYLSKSHNQSN